jgi:hypothetical protein
VSLIFRLTEKSFEIATLRDELIDGDIFTTLKEAKIVIKGWRRHYNTIRPHSSLRYHPPAPEVLQWPAAQPQPASPATQALATNQIVKSHNDRITSWGLARAARKRLLETALTSTPRRDDSRGLKISLYSLFKDRGDQKGESL